jgi:hypothetical protein
MHTSLLILTCSHHALDLTLLLMLTCRPVESSELDSSSVASCARRGSKRPKAQRGLHGNLHGNCKVSTQMDMGGAGKRATMGTY